MDKQLFNTSDQIIVKNSEPTLTLALGICDFGWGSMGKLRHILEHLPKMNLIPFELPPSNDQLKVFAETHHNIVSQPLHTAQAALVINAPDSADAMAAHGLPVIYVDSLPYLWVSDEEIPKAESTAVYCAQRFPKDRFAVSTVLENRTSMQWVDPIVPKMSEHIGGNGAIINLGGLHSHLSDDADTEITAYETLVLKATVQALQDSNVPIFKICGNISPAIQNDLQEMVDGDLEIGAHTPTRFNELLRQADLLVTSPGSTTMLQATSLDIPCVLLPPQNLSQIFNAQIFYSQAQQRIDWPEQVLSVKDVWDLRQQGEEVVVRYIYQKLHAAAADQQLVRDCEEQIKKALHPSFSHTPLRSITREIGSEGAQQVADTIEKIMIANATANPSMEQGFGSQST